jgi:hypothetical protein
MGVASHPAFEAKRTWFRRYRDTLLREAEPITVDSVATVELLLMEAEVDAARAALREAGAPRFDAGLPWFAQQVGTTCMSTSLANSFISLGEPLLTTGSEELRELRVYKFTSDVVARTSAMGKPGEYRSVDDLFKYLESGRLRELELEGGRFELDYRVRLTASLLDVVEGLWTGSSRLVIQRRAHAHLAFGLEREGDTWWVLMRDPMHGSGQGFSRATLETLRVEYMWSPLKKIPRIMGPMGFPSLSADELQGHLKRYDEMNDLGLECPSALVWRREDAPPIVVPPEGEGEKVRDEAKEPREPKSIIKIEPAKD